ncbi:hypothetical protein KIN20_012741 [Parelaphostrongylus tenuis]|uniref:Secreted protein n=1 Tax=Parelaphostrongylus tenuis TaxID=148309 RepID=A0AAD5QM29_PARTN|nr:hypothetical protein KIN20_012741 [Parelaphostrongylus tenuis]
MTMGEVLNWCGFFLMKALWPSGCDARRRASGLSPVLNSLRQSTTMLYGTSQQGYPRNCKETCSTSILRRSRRRRRK